MAFKNFMYGYEIHVFGTWMTWDMDPGSERLIFPSILDIRVILFCARASQNNSGKIVCSDKFSTETIVQCTFYRLHESLSKF